MAFHKIPYVATATVAFPDDYIKKLSKAMEVKDGMAYLHVLAPCPTGWRSPANMAVELSRMAVETGYFPLWEYENGKFNMTYEPKELKPLENFTSLMGRFRHLSNSEIQDLSDNVQDRLKQIKQLCEM